MGARVADTAFQQSMCITLAGCAVLGRTSWVQVLRTGRWWDPRYEWVEVDRPLLEAMAVNFSRSDAPAYADYDHGISAADGAGNAIVAGKILALTVLAGPAGRLDERREQEYQLWAEVEWTPKAAGKIQAREYRHTSAAFTRTFVNNRGEEVGPVLLGFAITNEPVVHGMEKVTLSRLDGRGGCGVEPKREVGAMTREETDRRLEAAVEQRMKDPDLAPLLTQGAVGRSKAYAKALARATSDVELRGEGR